MTTDTAVRIRGLRKSYHATNAVDGVDLDVERGEVFALLGPNGAGKTTTTEILGGHRARDGGDVQVLGVDPAQAGREWRARIGIVPQTANDLPEATVAEVVRQFATYYPRPRDPDRVIEFVKLTEKRDTRIRALSGGQRRRLDVALGIVGTPDLLFLDEPTTGFDPQARRNFWSLIENLAAEGTTVLLTTHYLDEAEALADRVGVIAAGRVIEVGTPTTLGGRRTAPATVSWTGPSGPASVTTMEPTQFVTRLAGEFGAEIPELAVHRPSLEDVYLEMIGAAS